MSAAPPRPDDCEDREDQKTAGKAAPGQGTLVLVVGPSGAGKDTLIDAARAALAGDARFVFVRRVITRPPGLPGEDYISATPEDFARRKARGEFALTWHAHGLDYGIPASIRDELARGRVVVVNASRSILDAARRQFPRVVVVEIRVSPEILRQRLIARGRETPEEIEERIARAGAFRVEGPDVVTISNDGPREQAAGAFIALLRRLADRCGT